MDQSNKANKSVGKLIVVLLQLAPLVLLPTSCHKTPPSSVEAIKKEIYKTQKTPEKTWEEITLEAKRLEKVNPKNFDVDTWLQDNKIIPKKEGLRVVPIEGKDWIGELRTCTIPSNIQRNMSPPIIVGLIVIQNGRTKIYSYPEGEKSLEYLNLGGDWLGYSEKDIIEGPKIQKK
jgi:hypothetical protein